MYVANAQGYVTPVLEDTDRVCEREKGEGGRACGKCQLPGL